MHPVLLCYALSPAKKGKLTVACAKAGARLAVVPEDRWGLRVEQVLAGEEGPAPLPGGRAWGKWPSCAASPTPA